MEQTASCRCGTRKATADVSLEDVNDDMELNTKEAAAYLSGPTGMQISTKFLYALKHAGLGPSVSKPAGRLVYRRSALDAYLTEYGTNTEDWLAGSLDRIINQIRAVTGQSDPALSGPFAEFEVAFREDWNPDELTDTPPAV